MKRWKRSFIVLVSLLISSAVEAKENTKKELPFYFPPGVVQTVDPVKQMQEMLRYSKATEYRFQGQKRSGGLVSGSDSVAIETNIESTSCSLNRNKPMKMKLVLDHYVRMNDGRIRVTFLDEQVIISKQQMQVVIDDLLAVVNEAADKNHAYYKLLEIAAVKSRAEKLGISENDFRKVLDKEVPGHGITFRELHRLPMPTRRSDFVPRELHLGYNLPLSGILGVTWLNTGIIYYNPQARILDYLMKNPRVMQHEMVHGNVNLQNFPSSTGFDVEFAAEIPIALYPENQLDIFFHGYNSDLRELIWIYFGFDFNQARSEIVKYDLAGNYLLDEKKFREYEGKLGKIKVELLGFFGETIIPEFYSDPVWWSAMNEQRKDQNSLFRIMFADYYDSTILGGRKETTQWLEVHRDEILELAKDSFEKMGQSKEDEEVSASKPRFSQMFYNRYALLFTEEERLRIQEYFQNNPEAGERVAKMTPKELLEFFAAFKKAAHGGGQ